MNPSREQVSSIQGYVGTLIGAWANDNAGIVFFANRPRVPNPELAPLVAARYRLVDVLDALAPETVCQFHQLPYAYLLANDIAANDSDRALAGFQMMRRSGFISDAEFEAVWSVLTRMERDPSLPGLISWAQAFLGRELDTADVNIARHSPGGANH